VQIRLEKQEIFYTARHQWPRYYCSKFSDYCGKYRGYRVKAVCRQHTHTHTPVDSRRRWHFCEFTALCRRLVPCEHHIGI